MALSPLNLLHKPFCPIRYLEPKMHTWVRSLVLFAASLTTVAPCVRDAFAATMPVGDGMVMSPERRPSLWPMHEGLNVRLSTGEEIALLASENAPWAGGIGKGGLWKTSDGLLWATRNGVQSASFFEPTFAAGQFLTVEAPFIDYGRAERFAVDIQLTGNVLTIDAFKFKNESQFRILIWPEDSLKSFLQPLAPLATGEYSVVARSFTVTHSGNSELDFDAFRANPLSYSLPAAASLEAKVERYEFAVTPEPSSFILSLFAATCGRPIIRGRRTGNPVLRST